MNYRKYLNFRPLASFLFTVTGIGAYVSGKLTADYHIYVLSISALLMLLVCLSINIVLVISRGDRLNNIIYLNADFLYVIYKSLKRKRKLKRSLFFMRITFYLLLIVIILSIAYLFKFESTLCKFNQNEIGILISNFRDEDFQNMMRGTILRTIEDRLFQDTKASFSDSIFRDVRVKMTNRFFKNKNEAINWAIKYDAKYILWGYKGKESYEGKKQIYVYFNPSYVIGRKSLGIEEVAGFEYEIMGQIDVDGKSPSIVTEAQIKSYVYEMIGWRAFHNKDYKWAIQLFESFPLHYPPILKEKRAIFILETLAMSYIYSGMRKKGVEYYIKMIDLIDQCKYTDQNLEASRAWQNIGSFLIEDAYYDKAIEALERSLSLYGNNYAACYDLARVHFIKKDYNRSIEFAELIPETNYYYLHGALDVLIKSHILMGNYSTAKQYLEKLSSLGGSFPEEFMEILKLMDSQ